MNFRNAKRLIYAVGIASVTEYLSIYYDVYILKLVSAVLQITAFLWSFIYIITLKNGINWKKFIPIIFVVAIYPLIRILIKSFSGYEFKTFTDALILYGSYYQLAFIGFALALLTKEETGYNLLISYSYLAVPLGIVLIFLLVDETSKGAEVVGLAHSAIANCFIPLSLIAFYPAKIRILIIGWLSITILLILSIVISSRSYLIVTVLIAVGAVFSIYKKGQRKLASLVLICGIIIFLIGGSFLLRFQYATKGIPINEKLQLNSLGERVNQFTKDKNIENLFYWEGNSRSTILVDAFINFDMFKWLFGVGIFTTYSSFIERSTIEVGWAQETFRWGLIYVLSIFIITFYGRKYLIQNKFLFSNEFGRILSALVLIRFLDGFVLGVPENSIYNLMFFWGVMYQCVHLNYYTEPYYETNN
jgi:hypothetical protein